MGNINDMKKNIFPEQKSKYLNYGHLGGDINFKKIVEDCSAFSTDCLLEIIENKNLDISIRETALLMYGSQWTKECLNEISKFLTLDINLKPCVCSLLSVYSEDFAVEITKKLIGLKLISCDEGEKVVNIIISHKKYGGDPVKAFGIPEFKTN